MSDPRGTADTTPTTAEIEAAALANNSQASATAVEAAPSKPAEDRTPTTAEIEQAAKDHALAEYDAKRSALISATPGGGTGGGAPTTDLSPEAFAADDAAIAAKRNAIAEAAVKKPVEPSTTIGDVGRGIEHKLGVIGSGFNTGAAIAAGSPADLVNTALAGVSKVGRAISPSMPELSSEKPVGGSAWFNDVLRSVHMNDTPNESDTDTVLGRLSQEFGAAAVPFGGIANAARRAGPIAQQGGNAISQGWNQLISGIAQHPVRAAGMEATAAAGGGTLAGAANVVFPNNPWMDMAADFLGSLGAPIGGRYAAATAQGAARFGRTMIDPDAAGRANAGREYRDALSNPQRTLQTLQSTPDSTAPVSGAPRSTFELTGDAGAGTQQRAASQIPAGASGTQTTPGGATVQTEFRTRQNQAIREAIQREAPTLTQDQIDQLHDNVVAELNNVGGVSTPDAVGRVVRAQLQRRLDDLETTRENNSDDLYRDARNNPRFVGLSEPRDILTEALKTAGGQQHRAKLQEALDALQDPVTGNLRNKTDSGMEADKALTAINQDRNVEKRTKLIVTQAQTALQRALGGTNTFFERAKAAWAAGSAPINAMIGEGKNPTPTGTVLERQRPGRAPYVVPDSGVVEEFMNKNGSGAVEAARNLRQSAGPAGASIVEDGVANWVRARLTEMAPNGRLTSKQLQDFRTQYHDALEQFPDVRDRLDNLAGAQRQVDLGLAKQRLWGRMQTAGLDLTGDRNISGASLRKFVDENVQSLRDAGWTQPQIDRLTQISRELDMIDRSNSATRATSGSDTAQVQATGRMRRAGEATANVLARVAAPILGAGFGYSKYGELGGIVGGMVSHGVNTGINSRIAQAQASRNYWLTRAIFEPEVARTLLMDAGPAHRPVVISRLRAHLIDAGHPQQQAPQQAPE